MQNAASPLVHTSLPDDLEQMIPLDKSWAIKIGVLDLAAGSRATIVSLSNYPTELSDDLHALVRASKQWLNGEDIEVGESGTLFRYLKAFAWCRGEERAFITSGTLSNRSITDDPNIIKYSMKKLLLLDGGTSQWASAIYLCTDSSVDDLGPLPYKLALAVEAKSHWLKCREENAPNDLRKDATIRAQAVAYITYLKTGKMIFTAEQAEDFCFANAYELMTTEEGAQKWPQLSGHESNRLKSVNESIVQMKQGEAITVADHRVVQAIAMRYGLEKSHFENPDCVTKSWPLFWQFQDTALKLGASAQRYNS